MVASSASFLAKCSSDVSANQKSSIWPAHSRGWSWTCASCAPKSPVMSPPPAAEVVSLGCRLNIAESETIRALIAGRDMVVVNSCAVTNEAVKQTRAAIRRATGCCGSTASEVAARTAGDAGSGCASTNRAMR